MSSDVNGDATVSCVRGGANGTLDTAAAGDDTVAGGMIFEGANRQCDTTATGDDVQWRPLGPLAGFFDWTNIKYQLPEHRRFRRWHAYAAVHQAAGTDVRDLRRKARGRRRRRAGRVARPGRDGIADHLQITLTNPRPTGAVNVSVHDVLPPALSFVSCVATGGGICGGSGNDRTITFAAIPGGGSATITLVAAVSCAVGNGTVMRTPRPRPRRAMPIRPTTRRASA